METLLNTVIWNGKNIQELLSLEILVSFFGSILGAMFTQTSRPVELAGDDTFA